MMASSQTYRISTVLEKPFVMKKDGGGYEGYIVDLLDQIAKQVGFKYNLIPSKDGHYGSRAADGTWSGMIGEVVNQEADIAAAGLTISTEREKVVDFTKPFMAESLRLLVKKPAFFSSSGTPGFLLIPFSDSVWLCILFALVLVAILLMLIGRFNPYEWRQVPSDKDPRGARHSFGLRESLMFVFSTMTLQGYRETPRSLAGRVLVVSWFIFIFLTAIAYIGQVVVFTLAWSQDTAPSLPSLPFDGVEDLAKQTKIQVGVIRNGRSFHMLRDSQVPAYSRLADYIELRNSFVNTTSEGVDRVLNSDGTFVMFMESLSAKYVTERDCSLMVYGESLFPSGFGLAVRQGSSLRDTLNMAILMLRENGILQMLKQRWWTVGMCLEPGLAKKGQHRFTARIMDMTKMAAPFMVLLVGAILSAIVLVGEVVFRKLRHPSQTTTPA